jgi:hypothetical protein
MKNLNTEIRGTEENGGEMPALGISDENFQGSLLKHSTAIDLIIPALLRAKRKFSVVIKNSENPFYKSRYADLAAIEKTIAQPLLENGLFIMQPANPHGSVSIFVTIETVVWHESGQFLSSSANIPYLASKKQATPDIHSIGSMITYFRRYLKLAFLDIVTDDDDGNQAMPSVHSQLPYLQSPPVHTAEMETLKADITKLDAETQKNLAVWSVSQLRSEQFKIVRDRVDKKLAAQ